MVAVEAGALDVVQGEDEDAHEVYTDPTDLHARANTSRRRDPGRGCGARGPTERGGADKPDAVKISV